MKKCLAEFLGTMILVIVGCGTAMVAGCDAQTGCGYILTALAFGFSFIISCYSYGDVSGCHINPAVSFAFWFNGKLSTKEFIFYVLSQVTGSFAGSVILWVIFSSGAVTDSTGCFGANTLNGISESWACGLVVEAVLTFIFVFVVLSVTADNSKTGSLSGIIIGITLSAVHFLGTGFTGTGVNPARSLGPALVNLLLFKNTVPIKCVWIFIAGPLVGSVLAASVHSVFTKQR